MDCQSLVVKMSSVSSELNISNEEESSELPGSELVGVEGGEGWLSKTSESDNEGSGGELEDGGIITL